MIDNMSIISQYYNNSMSKINKGFIVLMRSAPAVSLSRHVCLAVIGFVSTVIDYACSSSRACLGLYVSSLDDKGPCPWNAGAGRPLQLLVAH